MVDYVREQEPSLWESFIMPSYCMQAIFAFGLEMSARSTLTGDSHNWSSHFDHEARAANLRPITLASIIGDVLDGL